MANASSAVAALGGVPSTADTVDLLVKIGGQQLDGAVAACLLDVSVDQELGAAAHLTLRLAAWDSDTEELTRLDAAVFNPGTSVEVELGYLGQTKPMFWGEIVGLQVNASPTERAVLTIEAYDILHRLGRGQRYDKFEQTTYAGIARKIAQDVYKVAVDAEDDSQADPQNPVIYQENQSDFAFLTKLAAQIGYELFADADGKKLVFRKSQVGQPATLTLGASTDLVEFSAQLKAADQLGGVDVTVLDSATKKRIKVSVDNPDARDKTFGSIPSRSVIGNVELSTQEEATARANAELQRIQWNYLAATGSCFGRTDLRPGLMVGVSGLGNRFSGDYYVTSARHSLTTTGGYRTHFTLKGKPR